MGREAGKTIRWTEPDRTARRKDGWKQPRPLSSLKKVLQDEVGYWRNPMSSGSWPGSWQPCCHWLGAARGKMPWWIQSTGLGPLVSCTPGSWRSARCILMAATYMVVLKSMGFGALTNLRWIPALIAGHLRQVTQPLHASFSLFVKWKL